MRLFMLRGWSQALFCLRRVYFHENLSSTFQQLIFGYITVKINIFRKEETERRTMTIFIEISQR